MFIERRNLSLGLRSKERNESRVIKGLVAFRSFERSLW